IAYQNPHDTHHQAAVALFDQFAADRWLIHSLTLAEVLVGGARIGAAADMLSELTLLGIKSASLTPDESLRLAQLRVSTSLHLPDCCVIHLAQTHDATILTFDQRLGLAAQVIGLKVAPAAPN
ncbi:MAG: type II toxin-antitoxin system VapC family toxin, partial [Angustibacter sp.]